MKRIDKLLTLMLLCLVLAFSMLPKQLLAQLPGKERNILAKEAQSVDLAKVLITDNSWNNLPDYKNRQFWQSLPAQMREEYITKAERYLNYEWPVIKATDYLEFIRSGSRRPVDGGHSERISALTSLVMGELVEGKGRFLDQIINAVWFYSEQTYWGWRAGHVDDQNIVQQGLPDVNDPIVDLGVGEVANNLSWTWYLFKDEFDKVQPIISKRLKQEITNKVLIPYSERDDWGWMGFTGKRPNNWNPWINYNVLHCFLLLEPDPARKIAQVDKVINSLDKFLNGYSDDGGCDEGPSYWGKAGALLFESLDVLKVATNGEFDVFDDPLIQNIGKFFYLVNIHVPYFINFSDAPPTIGGNPSSVYRYGKAIKDPTMQQFGAYLGELSNLGEVSLDGIICKQIKDLTLLNEIKNAKAEEALVADFWLPDTEVAGARDKEGSYKGFFFGAKGGFNAESHNHNDVGSCVMYYDGKPCLIDLGREQYIAKTFGPQRYEIWTMRSAFHNLPVINGIDQKEGANFKAKNTTFTANDKSAKFTTDIAGAYPNEAKVKSWVRSYTLNRSKSFIISDNYIFTENTGEKTSSNLITYCNVSELKPGLLKLEGDGFNLNLTYNVRLVKPRIEYIEVKDVSFIRYWPDGVTRIVFEFINPGLKGSQTLTITASQ